MDRGIGVGITVGSEGKGLICWLLITVKIMAPATVRKMRRDRKNIYLNISGLFLVDLGEDLITGGGGGGRVGLIIGGGKTGGARGGVKSEDRGGLGRGGGGGGEELTIGGRGGREGVFWVEGGESGDKGAVTGGGGGGEAEVFDEYLSKTD